ncbi:hypothetical protein PVAP13_1NG432019 [Panicum virgatum]|uniref:Uncharacterized protein n=1 Tax=Panicum virgatum TaxID=38727 RepID=A0A8T0X712_PANVG|nr:hypothetical protein PVAP13_1NG432019 [Panicum virgatum]
MAEGAERRTLHARPARGEIGRSRGRYGRFGCRRGPPPGGARHAELLHVHGGTANSASKDGVHDDDGIGGDESAAAFGLTGKAEMPGRLSWGSITSSSISVRFCIG